MNSIPRPEYPRPQFVRDSWMNLNGIWQFEIDNGKSGRARGLVDAQLSGEINVPFCPESKLSGVAHVDFMAAVWYKRCFILPAEAIGKRTILHFGAVDYFSQVWVNGKDAGTHVGGYVSFSLDITKLLKEGENVIAICAEDDNRSGKQPRGKQSSLYHSHNCDYTRTTGIWQTVWLEWVNFSYIGNVKYTPDAENGALLIEAELNGSAANKKLVAVSSFCGATTGEASATTRSNVVRLTLNLNELHLWNVGEPNLYDLKLSLYENDSLVDVVDSYFGLRTISFDGMKCMINNRPVFQRLVLDQGFNPDGIYTAPTDEFLKNDILLSMAMGFNGARLHEKVFEQRFYYWADKLGYLCWGEMANWGLDHTKPEALEAFLNEWLQVVKRDYSVPSIIGWCPFNETWDLNGTKQDNEVLRMIYRATKAIDTTRPCIDTSGNFHVETDIFDVHDYDQVPATFAEKYQKGTVPIHDNHGKRQSYGGQPVFVSEYGGIWWNPGDSAGWGYGQRPESEEEFLKRYEGLTNTLIDNPDHMGFCYTQLTDVEQEVNGLYTYNRVPKFDPKIIHKINSRKAACEE